jgi:hypothetical protein
MVDTKVVCVMFIIAVCVTFTLATTTAKPVTVTKAKPGSGEDNVHKKKGETDLLFLLFLIHQ